MAGFGTPIRLILDDDQKTAIELTAVSMAMSVDRGVGGAPIPFTGGKRFGVDLNLVSSTIIIDGIFTDDDDNPRSSSAVAASALVEFNISTQHFADRTPTNIDDHGDIKDIIGKTLTMQNTTGTEYVVTFTEASSGTVGTGATSGSTTATVLVKNTSTGVIATSAQLASGLVQAIGTFSGTPFSASVVESFHGPTYGNSKVTITQNTAGVMSSDNNFRFHPTTYYTPYNEPFMGGVNAGGVEAKSAGDKVQDLYGILHNTTRGQMARAAGTAVGAGLAAAAIAATGGLAGSALLLGGAAAGTASGGVIGSGVVQEYFSLGDDYPIGLQIPYNSTIQATNGDKYTVRNFLTRTGIGLTKKEKGSDENNQSAGVTFSTMDNTTGIQGTISKFDIGYDAGDSVYTFQMIFTPIDMIVS